MRNVKLQDSYFFLFWPVDPFLCQSLPAPCGTVPIEKRQAANMERVFLLLLATGRLGSVE